MRTITVNEFETRYNKTDKALSDSEYFLLLNKDNAIGVISTLNDDLFKYGFVQWIGVKAFQNGDLTLRQLAGLLKSDVENTIKLLNALNIPLIDYNFSEDLEAINSL